MKGLRGALLLFWVVVGPAEGGPKGKHVKSRNQMKEQRDLSRVLLIMWTSGLVQQSSSRGLLVVANGMTGEA